MTYRKLITINTLVFACATSAFAQPAAPTATTPGGGHGKAEFITSYDASGDSIVTRAEFDARRSEHYARTDADRRGGVSEAEYVGDYTTRLDRELAEMRARQLAQAHVRFGVLDTNDDNAISAEEFAASGARMFGQLDTNRDGSVDERDTNENY